MAPALPSGAVEVTNVVLLCRGVNRSSEANSQLAFAVRQFLTNSPSFSNPVGLKEVLADEDTNTFQFEVTVNLRKHFKLQ
jgi:hypothetical protein